MKLTEQEKEKQEYLQGYERAIRQMKRSELKMKEIRMNKICPSRILDGMPRAAGQNDLSSFAARLDEEERRYMKARYKRIRLCREITDKIERLESEDEKDVLMYRYIKRMKWEEVSEQMYCSLQHVHRIHKKGDHHSK